MKRAPSMNHANTRARQLALGFIVLLLLVGIAVWSLRSRAQTRIGGITAADPTNQQLVSLGQQLYDTRCASCHGGNLEGEPNWQQPQANGTLPAPPLGATGPSRQRTDQQLFAIIANGGQATAPAGTVSGMPAFSGSLSDEQNLGDCVVHQKHMAVVCTAMTAAIWHPSIRAVPFVMPLDKRMRVSGQALLRMRSFGILSRPVAISKDGLFG